MLRLLMKEILGCSLSKLIHTFPLQHTRMEPARMVLLLSIAVRTVSSPELVHDRHRTPATAGCKPRFTSLDLIKVQDRGLIES